MKKYILIFIGVMLIPLFSSCDSHRLEEMENSYRSHIRMADEENNMHTKLEAVVPISFIKLKEDEKVDERDVYLAKIYVVSKSWYSGGSRVFNLNDTLEVYFDKNRRYIRTK